LKTSVLGTFAATALLAMTITACGGTSAPATGSQAATGAPAATTASAPTPTPTPTPKAYTAEELSAVLAQLQDSSGRKLSVMASSDLAGSIEQGKALIASMDVQPAECKEMAASTGVPALDGVVMAAGQSLDAAAGSMTMLTLATGLDEAFVAGAAAQEQQLAACSAMTMTVSGVTADVTLTPLDAVGTIPGTLAFRTDTFLPDGQVQSVITAQALQQGVLFTAVAAGGESEAEAVARTGALMDSAAALLK
jgi:hypothetical protein